MARRNDDGKGEVARALALFFQIGLNMLIPPILCLIIGAYVDRLFDTSWIAIVLFIMGVIAGMQNVYKLIKRYLKDEKSPGELKREADEREAREKKLK